MQSIWIALAIVSLTVRYFARQIAIVVAIILGIAVVAMLAGCSPSPDDTRDAFPWQHRAMAEIAIVSTTADATPQPKPPQKVGERCKDCNDPPGDCGVGRVGDGTPSGCNRCQTCGADGRIDERDVAQLLGDSEQLPERSLTLRMSYGSQKWGSDWWETRQQFIDAGWDVRSLIHTEGVLAEPVIEAVDGKFGTSFDAPLTLEQLREWSE